jgi:hypothetical protein
MPPTEEELGKLVIEWRERVLKAVRTVENRCRAAKGQKPLDPEIPIILPGGRHYDFSLLNFRVWELRYGVTPEFQVEALRRAWPRRYRVTRRSNIYMLTISARNLTTDAAERHIEEAAVAAYPCGEQFKILQTRPRPPIPRIRLDLNDPDAFLRKYNASIERVRREQEKRDDLIHKSRRNYRKPVWPPRKDEEA